MSFEKESNSCDHAHVCGSVNHEHEHSHENNHDHSCNLLQNVKMRVYHCGKPQPKGPLIHNDHIYVNLVEGNLVDPALGVGQGTYAGAFDLVSLINYVISNPQ